jgi:cysteine synthase B
MVEYFGNTPMVELTKYNFGNVRFFAKLEGVSIGGSIKDRVGAFMIHRAVKQGYLTKGDTIIEATSGNTGIGLAIAAVNYGFPCKLLVPKSTAKSKIKMMKAFGATVEIIDGTIDDCIGLVEAMSVKSNYVWLNQYDNQASVDCHASTTAVEIDRWMTDLFAYFDWSITPLEGYTNILVCAMGTTGTIMGCSKYFKPLGWEIYGVMPDPKCKIEGLKNLDIQRRPKIFDRREIEQAICVNDKEAKNMVKDLALKEGLLVGPSSGAAMTAALYIAKLQFKVQKTNIVVIFPDRGERYL